MPDNDSPDDGKTVTIFVVHSNGDDEDDEWFPTKEQLEDSNDITFAPPSPKKKNIKLPPKEKVSPSKKFKINRGNPVENLEDLIKAFIHPRSDENQDNLVKTLTDLNDMIGMEKLKQQIVNQILFFIQDLQEPGMFLHTVLTGSPGSGKTTVCDILAKIYSFMGILDTSKVTKACRADLIGKYLGTTAIKTKEVLDSAKGGVLLLDEVYSLGNKEGGDSFSKECIDTINQYLSEHVDDFICIIAGYKDKVDECFFSYNPGLSRRFPWRFDIDDYKVEDLHKIMELQLKQTNWEFDETVQTVYINNIIKENKEHFTGNGGDTRNLIDKCKICHARRIFTLEPPVKKRRGRKGSQPISSTKKLNREDIENGLKSFVESKCKKEEEDMTYMGNMYM
jgi:stage V sporulation protein K